MTLQYRNTFRDMLAFFRYNQLHNWASWLMLGLIFIATTVVTIRSLPPRITVIGGVLLVILAELLLLCLTVAFTVTSSIVYLALTARKNRTFLTEHTLTLSPEGLIGQNAFATTTYTWAAVVRIARTNGHLFLYTAQDAALVIPRRAVTSREDWDAVYHYACTASAKAAPNM